MRVFYDSLLAKTILPKGFSTITLFGLIFTKYTKDQMSDRTLSHEKVHVDQYTEIRNISLFLSIIFTAIYCNHGGNVVWYPINITLSYCMFYVLYVLEWIIKLIIWGLFNKKKGYAMRSAYYSISFEKEAYHYQNYPEQTLHEDNYRPTFGWITRIF